MTPIIRSILVSLDSETETIITFEKDEYHFYKDGSLHQMSYASGSLSAENDTIFHINQKRNVTIDGNGSDFVFCDRVQPFTLKNTKNITLKNFAIDFSFMRYAYADIISISDDGMELYLDPSMFRYSVRNGALIFHCGVEDMSTETRKISCKPISGTSSICFLYIGTFHGIYNPAAPNVLAYAEKTEKGVFLRYNGMSAKPNFSVGARVCLAYDNDREMQAMHCEFCENITLQNIHVYRQGGMGFVADICKNITFDQLRIQLKHGRDEYFTTTADGIFLTNCSGKVILRNSIIEDTYDDAMNVHGFYIEVDAILSDKQIRLAHAHSDHWGLLPYKTGDIISFTDPITYHEVGSAEIETVFYDEDRRNMVVTLCEPISLSEHMLVENRTRMPYVLIEDNTIKNCPHMRLSSQNMIIRRNYLSLNASDIYIDDLVDFYKEYGAVHSVLIAENHFGKTAGHNIHVLSQRPKSSNHLHKKIIIENNEFEKEKDSALQMSHILDLIERNNRYSVD